MRVSPPVFVVLAILAVALALAACATAYPTPRLLDERAPSAAGF